MTDEFDDLTSDGPESVGPQQPEDDPDQQQNMFPRTPGSSVAEDVGGRRTVQLKSYKSLETLRDRVMLTSRELARLRTENAELHRQVEELKSGVAVQIEGSTILLTETPAVLRSKVEGFIEAIDQYLQDDLADEIRGRGASD
ncbi:MAG: hypothetical protein ACI80V_003672 [Rhodothermales bacterium]|jgi:hypothetical protein